MFGGTFDPPHVGHLIVAQDAVEALGLDELRFVVAGDPPHKAESAASPEQRARMTEAAVGDDPRLRVSRVELEREGASYTVDTLRRLREDEPDAGFVLLIGADQLRDFASWREPGEIARLARLVVMAREGHDPRRVDPSVDLGVDVEYDVVDVTRVDISSTRIRERISSGRSVRYLVPAAVRRIIEAEGLYRDPSC